MTRQTARPIDHTSLNPSYQTMAGLVLAPDVPCTCGQADCPDQG